MTIKYNETQLDFYLYEWCCKETDDFCTGEGEAPSLLSCSNWWFNQSNWSAGLYGDIGASGIVGAGPFEIVLQGDSWLGDPEMGESKEIIDNGNIWLIFRHFTMTSFHGKVGFTAKCMAGMHTLSYFLKVRKSQTYFCYVHQGKYSNFCTYSNN